MALFGSTNKNARLIGTALLIITFVAGGLAGAAVIRVLSAESRSESTATVARSGGSKMKGGPRRLLQDPEFAKEIGLTAQQSTRIEEILDRRDAEAKKLWDGFEPRLKQVGQQVHKEIEAVLTPEQQQKLNAALAKRRGEHKKHRECGLDSTKAASGEKAS